MNAHEALINHLNKLDRYIQAKSLQEMMDYLPECSRECYNLCVEINRLNVGLYVWTKLFKKEKLDGCGDVNHEFIDFAKNLKSVNNILSKTPAELVSIINGAREITSHAKELRLKLEALRSQWKKEKEEEIYRLRSFIRVPDLFLEESKCEAVESLLNQIENFMKLTDDELKQNLKEKTSAWVQLQRQFDEVKEQLSFDNLARRYNLRRETVQVIQRLVNGQTLTLDQISSQTLSELGNFTRFQALIQLSFAPEGKRG